MIFALTGLILAIGIKIILICHPRDQPMGACRRLVARGYIKLCTHAMCIFGWFTFMSYDYVTLDEVDHYEEYLGTVEEQREYQR